MKNYERCSKVTDMSDDEAAAPAAPVEEVITELSEEAVRKTGQKFVTPSPGYADRVFYESLLRQRPDSEMAQEWCVQYGILPEERAAQLWKLICKRKASGSSPSKKSSSSSSSSSSNPPKKQKTAKVVDATAIVADTGVCVHPFTCVQRSHGEGGKESC